MSGGDRLDVRAFEADDEARVIALLKAALGEGPTGDRTSDFFRWKHRESPFGASPGLVAVHEGQVVGVRLFLRWELEARGRQVRAVRAVDTATDPAFQGRGIFRTLTLELLHQLEDRGEVDLVFNTPNGNSRPGYLKMGWQEVGTLPLRLGVSRPLRFARGLRTATAATAVSTRRPGHVDVGSAPLPPCPFPTATQVLSERSGEVRELVDASGGRLGLHTPRTLEYLRWRYADAPGLDYRALTVGNGDGVDGVAFGRLRRRGSLSEFTLSELLVREGDVSTARSLLRSARRSGADHVAVHTSQAAERRAAAAAGYVTVPRYGLGLVANPRRTLPVDPLDVRSWQLCLGDLEVF